MKFQIKQKARKQRIYTVSELFALVRQTGLEPVRQGHTPLKRACLPIPALALSKCYYSSRGGTCQGVFAEKSAFHGNGVFLADRFREAHLHRRLRRIRPPMRQAIAVRIAAARKIRPISGDRRLQRVVARLPRPPRTVERVEFVPQLR